MERLGDDVRGELARFGPAPGMGDLVAAWPGAVGEQIARNAWPARIARDGTLHVAASSSAWAFELGQLAPEILARLRELLGEAAPPRLRFAPGQLPERGADAELVAQSHKVVPGPQERAHAERLVAALEDEELRALVVRAAAASLARGAAGRPV